MQQVNVYIFKRISIEAYMSSLEIFKSLYLLLIIMVYTYVVYIQNRPESSLY